MGNINELDDLIDDIKGSINESFNRGYELGSKANELARIASRELLIKFILYSSQFSQSYSDSGMMYIYKDGTHLTKEELIRIFLLTIDND